MPGVGALRSDTARKGGAVLRYSASPRARSCSLHSAHALCAESQRCSFFCCSTTCVGVRACLCAHAWRLAHCSW
jgi:hypothetical protein